MMNDDTYFFRLFLLYRLLLHVYLLVIAAIRVPPINLTRVGRLAQPLPLSVELFAVRARRRLVEIRVARVRVDRGAGDTDRRDDFCDGGGARGMRFY